MTLPRTEARSSHSATTPEPADLNGSPQPSQASGPATRRVHYVLSSHWDREWYQPFQYFRHRLVQLLDRVLAAQEDGRLLGPFQTDGQAVILDDYLEIRPEKRPQIEQAASTGGLVIGPWYVLPDEFLVSGESLIRNLRLGRATARRLGGTPSDAGFVCDLFGHISQLPQIFGNFGIRSGLIWRGTNDKDTRLVRWIGADGTDMLCYRFGPYGYCGFANLVRRASDPQGPGPQSHSGIDAARFAKDLEAFLQAEDRLTPAGPLLLFDGGDHQAWDEAAYALLRQGFERSARTDEDRRFELVHSSLDAFLSEMVSHAGRVSRVIAGELREPALHAQDEDMQLLITGVLSSRVRIKQANARCETLLCHWAEPWSLIDHLTAKTEYPQGFLDVAWRWLLKNHPHDSIGGCSIDRVHEDMKFRFSQCEQIGTRLSEEALRGLAARVEGPLTDDELRVVVFNPLPIPFEQTSEVVLEVPVDWPVYRTHGSVANERILHIQDHRGEPVAFQQISQKLNQIKTRLHPTRMPQTDTAHDVTVSLPLRIPAMGYTTLTIRRGNEREHQRLPYQKGLATGACSMANGLLSVVIENNGTLSLTDERTGQTYRGLMAFEDAADRGDGWMFGPVVGDQVFVSTTARAAVALVANGPMRTTFRIRTAMQVPAAFDDGNDQRRSEECVDVVIVSDVTLRPGSEHLEVETIVDNRARDHRLRLLLPTHTPSATYLADGAFDVLERLVAMRADNHLYREPEVETKPQQSWTAVVGTGRGLAVVAPGLYESAVIDRDDRPIALTLFRSTGRTVMTNGEEGGQLLGRLRFRYAIVPLLGQADRASLTRLGQRLGAGLRTVQLGPAQLHAEPREGGALPGEMGFLRVEGQAVVTAFCLVGGAPELRLFNPEAHAITATIHLPTAGGWVPRVALPADFEGRAKAKPLPIVNGQCEVMLEAKQIVTLQMSC